VRWGLRNKIIGRKSVQEKYFKAGSVLLPGGLQTLIEQLVKNRNTWNFGNKLRWHQPLLFKRSLRRTSSVGQWRCSWFGKIAVRKQAVESACLNLLSLNFRIINWEGLLHYGINFEQQTVLCLRQCVRICMYVNIGSTVQNTVFISFWISLSEADQQFVQNVHSIIYHLWRISLPIWFDNVLPFSGSHYHKCILAIKLIRVLLVLVVISIILKWILISLTQEKFQMLRTQTICSKTYSGVVITLLILESKQAESWQSNETR